MKPDTQRSTAHPETPPKPPTSQSEIAAPLLPHERDQLADAAARPDARIVQAKKDLDAGLVDTDMRVTPGLDAARREALVPGPAGKLPDAKKKKRS